MELMFVVRKSSALVRRTSRHVPGSLQFEWMRASSKTPRHAAAVCSVSASFAAKHRPMSAGIRYSGTVFPRVSVDDICVERAALEKGERKEVIDTSEACEVHDRDGRFVLYV